MNPASTSFILGYHGCDRSLAERVFAGKVSLQPSHNDYDWLGDGIYFWEHNAQRAFEYAEDVAARPRHAGHSIRTPAVVGAVIDLGLCLNLLDSRFTGMVRDAHERLVRASAVVGVNVPENRGGADLLNRRLDCAVIRMLHEYRNDIKESPFDSIRAAFVEGDPIYAGAGFAAKTHIQICVRDLRCIKGYFRPLDDSGKPITFAKSP